MPLFSLFLSLFFIPSLLFGGYSHVSGKWSPERYVPVYSVQEHYDRGYQEMNEKNWDQSLTDFMIIYYHYPDSPFFADSVFYTGVCYYNKSEFDLANKQFDRYLLIGAK